MCDNFCGSLSQRWQHQLCVWLHMYIHVCKCASVHMCLCSNIFIVEVCVCVYVCEAALCFVITRINKCFVVFQGLPETRKNKIENTGGPPTGPLLGIWAKQLCVTYGAAAICLFETQKRKCSQNIGKHTHTHIHLCLYAYAYK